MTDTTTPITPTPEWTAALKRRFWTSRGADRITQAIALRQRGFTYQEIADRLGYSHRMGAYQAVNHSSAANGQAAA